VNDDDPPPDFGPAHVVVVDLLVLDVFGRRVSAPAADCLRLLADLAAWNAAVTELWRERCVKKGW
jgi:hypothetical protein